VFIVKDHILSNGNDLGPRGLPSRVVRMGSKVEGLIEIKEVTALAALFVEENGRHLQ